MAIFKVPQKVMDMPGGCLIFTYGHVDHVGPGHPAVLPLYGGLWRAHLPDGNERRRDAIRKVSLETAAGGTGDSRSVGQVLRFTELRILV